MSRRGKYPREINLLVEVRQGERGLEGKMSHAWRSNRLMKGERGSNVEGIRKSVAPDQFIYVLCSMIDT